MTLYIQDLLKGNCIINQKYAIQSHFWVPWTIYFKIHTLFFKKRTDNFEIEHKKANFKSGVQYSLKRKTSTYERCLYSCKNTNLCECFFKHVGSRYQREFTTLQQHSRFSSKYFKDMIIIRNIFPETPEITTPLTLSSEDGSVSQNPAASADDREGFLFSLLLTPNTTILSHSTQFLWLRMSYLPMRCRNLCLHLVILHLVYSLLLLEGIVCICWS